MGVKMTDEDILAKCAGVIGVRTIGMHDDFFGVGGDSLDAVEVSEMLCEEFGSEVSVETVLRSANFGEMLKSIRG